MNVDHTADHPTQTDDGVPGTYAVDGSGRETFTINAPGRPSTGQGLVVKLGGVPYEFDHFDPTLGRATFKRFPPKADTFTGGGGNRSQLV